MVKSCWKHILGQDFQELLANDCRSDDAVVRLVEECDFLAVAIVQNTCISDSFNTKHLVFDFEQLNSVPQVLDLKILAADKHDLAAFISVHQVTSAIYELRIARIQGILDERPSRCFNV